MRQPLVFPLYCAIIHALKNKNFSGLQTAYEGGFAARKSRQERRCILELTSIGKKKKIRKKLPHHKMRHFYYGRYRARTCDLSHVKRMLSQLS